MEIAPLPKIGAKAWFLLRSKAESAPSTKFTPSFVAAALQLANAESARGNILRPMRALGIFDDDGSLTLLGNKWRNKATYAEACQEIVSTVYPRELAGLTDTDGKPSISQVRTWLTQHGFGASNARQMSATYVMIASHELPSGTVPNEGRKPTPPTTTKGPAKRANASAQGSPQLDESLRQHRQPSPPANESPGIHLDIQIHVPADASPDQIDAIFRSMAKHIYGRVTD